MWERLGSSWVLIVHRGCDSLWVCSCIMWEECSSPWRRCTQTSIRSWSAFNFWSSFLWHRFMSAMRVWSCWRVSVYIMAIGGGLKPLKKVSHLRPDRVLTMVEMGRPWGKFYHGPTVGAKCTYQNLELFHVRVDVAKVGSKISNVGRWAAFVQRTRMGTYKLKNFDA